MEYEVLQYCTDCFNNFYVKGHTIVCGSKLKPITYINMCIVPRKPFLQNFIEILKWMLQNF